MATGDDGYAKALRELLVEIDSKHDMYKQHLNQAALELDADKKKEIEELAQKYLDEYETLFERLNVLLCEEKKEPEGSEVANSTKTLASNRLADIYDESDEDC